MEDTRRGGGRIKDNDKEEEGREEINEGKKTEWLDETARKKEKKNK